MNVEEWRKGVMEQDSKYMSGLEAELQSKNILITQKDSQIIQLHHLLNKLKEQREEQEKFTSGLIDKLEIENNRLKTHLHEVIKQNQDLRGDSACMEHKVDTLTQQNGDLSKQMTKVSSELDISKAEVTRLTETLESAEAEWSCLNHSLQAELSQATAQKELISELHQILQGKITCVEDELRRVTKEEKGESMGPIMEKVLQNEIYGLKDELEAKEQQLVAYRQDITNLLGQVATLKAQLACADHNKIHGNEEVAIPKKRNRDLNTTRTAQSTSITMTKKNKKTSAASLQLHSRRLYSPDQLRENQPESDWRRLVELQARNKACRPHLKSSYPTESVLGVHHAFTFLGSPSKTTRRASMMPGQLPLTSRDPNVPSESMIANENTHKTVSFR